jgi:hypothetical protein
MRDYWLSIVDRLLSPERPKLAHCLAAREGHLALRQQAGETRARAIADCERRIERERAVVFAANDGVVGATMTELEREWRILSRSDPDHGLMDLWARIAPPSWMDRKRWRDSEPARRLDAAIVLASDPNGVDDAEAAVRGLRRWFTFGLKVRFCFVPKDRFVASLLEAPIRGARPTLASSSALALRARRLERDVRAAVRGRFPERPALARGLGRAAYLDVLSSAHGNAHDNAAGALSAIWRTGYSVTELDNSGITLEMPPLD